MAAPPVNRPMVRRKSRSAKTEAASFGVALRTFENDWIPTNKSGHESSSCAQVYLDKPGVHMTHPPVQRGRWWLQWIVHPPPHLAPPTHTGLLTANPGCTGCIQNGPRRACQCSSVDSTSCSRTSLGSKGGQRRTESSCLSPEARKSLAKYLIPYLSIEPSPTIGVLELHAQRDKVTGAVLESPVIKPRIVIYLSRLGVSVSGAEQEAKRAA